jgi:4-carboxymuconolactone decarboxylase
MARVDHLKPEELTAEQQRIATEIASTRTRVGGPFGIWLRTPAIADAANKLGQTLRRDGKLDKRLFELAVLLMVRNWGAHYAWHVHDAAGRAAGLPDDVIAAIRERRTPRFSKPDEQLIYDVISELLETKAVSSATYQRALDALGLELVIELIAVAGFYTMVAMTLNTFEVATPDGSKPLAN